MFSFSMPTTLDYAKATIDELHRGIHALGSEEQKRKADALLYGNLNIGIGLTESFTLDRNAMMSLMATVEWEHSFTKAAEEERREIVRRTFSMPIAEQLAEADAA